MRVDKYLAQYGYAKSREAARKLLEDGVIIVGGRRVKPSLDIDESSPPEISRVGELPRYVSRGGLKLEYALESFALDVTGLDAVDIGASSGGFTDCLLQHGASRVRAVDVGHSQLDPKLACDPRVVSYEGINARGLTPEQIGGQCDLAVCDVSFISLTLILPAVTRILKPDGIFVGLIKPQFEAGRTNIGKGGIVRNRDVHVEVINRVLSAAESLGLGCNGVTSSPIEGGDGNREYLAVFVRGESHIDEKAITAAVYGE